MLFKHLHILLSKKSLLYFNNGRCFRSMPPRAHRTHLTRKYLRVTPRIHTAQTSRINQLHSKPIKSTFVCVYVRHQLTRHTTPPHILIAVPSNDARLQPPHYLTLKRLILRSTPPAPPTIRLLQSRAFRRVSLCGHKIICMQIDLSTRPAFPTNIFPPS